MSARPLPVRLCGSNLAFYQLMALITTPVSQQVIGCAIKVHRALGPGLFESAYHRCLVHELVLAGLVVKTHVPLQLTYGGMQLQCAFRADLIVEGQLLIELKSVEQIHPVHHAQVLTYLRLAGVRHGLLINFNAKLLKDGLKSFLMGQPEPAAVQIGGGASETNGDN